MNEAQAEFARLVQADPGFTPGSQNSTEIARKVAVANIPGFETKYPDEPSQMVAVQQMIRSDPDLQNLIGPGMVSKTSPAWMNAVTQWVVPIGLSILTKRPAVVAGGQAASEFVGRSAQDYMAGRDPMQTAPQNMKAAAVQGALGYGAQKLAGPAQGMLMKPFMPPVNEEGQFAPLVQAGIDVARKGESIPTLGQISSLDPVGRPMWAERQIRGMMVAGAALDRLDTKNMKIATDGIKREFGELIQNQPTAKVTETIKAALLDKDDVLSAILPRFHAVKRELYSIGDNMIEGRGLKFNVGRALQYLRDRGDDPAVAKVFSKMSTFDEVLAQEKNFTNLRALIKEQGAEGAELGIQIPPDFNADIPIEQVMRMEKNLNKIITKSSDAQEVEIAKNFKNMLADSKNVLPEEAREAYRVANRYYGDFMEIWNRQNLKLLRKRLDTDSTLVQNLFTDASTNLDTYRALKKVYEQTELSTMAEEVKGRLSEPLTETMKAIVQPGAKTSFEKAVVLPTRSALADRLFDSGTGQLNFSRLRQMLGDFPHEKTAALQRDFAKELWGEESYDKLVEYARAGELFQSSNAGSSIFGSMMQARGIQEATMPQAAGPGARALGVTMVLPYVAAKLFTNKKFMNLLIENAGKPISQIAPSKVARIMAIVGSENETIKNGITKMFETPTAKYEKFFKAVGNAASQGGP